MKAGNGFDDTSSVNSNFGHRFAGGQWRAQLTWAARMETTRHAAIDCFKYTPGSPLSP
jgi:hypothetical protein